MQPRSPHPPVVRNDRIYDAWSWVHVSTGITLGWLLPAPIALLLIVLHEPFETQLLSPFLWRRFGVIYGYEALPNSLADIAFGCIGLLVGHFTLGTIVGTPFHWL